MSDLQDAVALADELLELEISRVAALVPMGVTHSERKALFEELTILCGQRSAEQVKRLERVRGLSR
jgi:hypothetical protein